eukprot:gene5882-7305_t
MRLSVIAITRNEAANLRACLESVAFAHEIIVVDNASTDGTADLARALGARVTHTDDAATLVLPSLSVAVTTSSTSPGSSSLDSHSSRPRASLLPVHSVP